MGIVSLVLATYGRCDELGRLLDTLVAQSDTAFEVLVIDQNPDDRLCGQVQRGLDCGLSIRHLRLDRPSLSGARNLGLQQARGDVIGFPDDDCWYEPETIARVRSAFGEKKNVDGLVGCWVEQFAATGGETTDEVRLSYAAWRRFRGKSVSSITIFFHRGLFDLAGDFDERFGVDCWYGAGEETDLILRALAAGARLEYRSSIRVHHEFSRTSASLPALCRTMRKRGRGVGGIYAKHEMSMWVIFRGVLGLVLRPLMSGRLRSTLVGMSAFLGSLEGLLRWRLTQTRTVRSHTNCSPARQTCKRSP